MDEARLEHFQIQAIVHSHFHEGLMGLLTIQTKRATPWSSSFLHFIILGFRDA